MDASKILEDREKRATKVASLINDYDVVTLHANIPGINKNLPVAYLLVNYFNKELLKLYSPIDTIYEDSADGPYYIYTYIKGTIKKESLIKLEETTLGRFIDLDIFSSSNISIQRSTPRRCFLCNKMAHECARNKTHTSQELLDYIENNVTLFLKDYIDNLIQESALNELNLTMKFGLVSPITSGSHKDMDYNLMNNSIKVISPYITKMFMEGYTYPSIDIKDLFKKVNIIGLEADKAMFDSTNNINTYQGLIFNLGLVATSLGYVLNNNLKIDDLYDLTSKMIDHKDTSKGALKEAFNKYTNVRNIVAKYSFDSDDNKRLALIDLIINVEDTIFFKRCPDIKTREDIINQFKLLLKTNDSQLMNQINNKCEELNLSFGGCADLLVVAMFISKVQTLIRH